MHQNPLQPMALLVRGDLAADADVRDGWHEHQEPAGQGNMRSNARALLGDGLLGNLNQNLLARLQQIADHRQIRGLHRAARRTTAPLVATLLSAATSTAATASTALAALLACTVSAGRRAFTVLLFFFFKDLVLAALLVEVELDAVIEVRFLQHLTQFTGANLRGKRLFFVVVEIVDFVLWCRDDEAGSNSSPSITSSSIRPAPGA